MTEDTRCSGARALAGGALALLLASGCSGVQQACTEIGAPSGISVTVEAGPARELDTLILTACWDGSCTDHTVALTPGGDTVDQGCAGGEPDAACSATAVPDDTLVGFVELPGLPTGPIAVSARATTAEGARPFEEVEVTSETVYPNGRSCPAGGNQARLTVSDDGLR